MSQSQIITAAEATALWGLHESTVRRAIMEDRLPARKSAGTWLVDMRDMERLYGEPKSQRVQDSK